MKYTVLTIRDHRAPARSGEARPEEKARVAQPPSIVAALAFLQGGREDEAVLAGRHALSQCRWRKDSDEGKAEREYDVKRHGLLGVLDRDREHTAAPLPSTTQPGLLESYVLCPETTSTSVV
ncbi:hypothetical protein BD413DRAFT_612319 [Trametes elegans]|nr:hypothetical protein BD413DRAFT_612319 [Trametes elegans]